jgi:hypothetical protein
MNLERNVNCTISGQGVAGRSEMARILINFTFVVLLPFFKAERMVADVARGRRNAMIKIYNLVMDSRHNPLSHIPDTNTRHLVMQVLAWMWCIIFSMWMGSIVVFGVSATIHALLLAGIFITVGVFETAKRKPDYFGGLGRANGGEHE